MDSAPVQIPKLSKGDPKKDIEKSLLEFSLNDGKKDYILEIGTCKENIIIVANDELDLSDEYYKVSLTYEKAISLNKCFRLCDDLEEVKQTFKLYIENAIKEEKNFDVNLSQKNLNELELNMKVEVNKKIYDFTIKLNKIEKDPKVMNEKLRNIINLCIQEYGKDNIINLINKNKKNEKNVLKKGKMSLKWKEGPNYTLDETKSIATSKGQGACWDCTIISDKPLPKNSISTWGVKIKNLNPYTNNTWELTIGVAPFNINQNAQNNYGGCWTLICGRSNLFCNSGYSSTYPSNREEIKNGDIIRVKMDTQKGEISFSLNGKDFGVACNGIPTDKDLVPVALSNNPGNIVELVK